MMPQMIKGKVEILSRLALWKMDLYNHGLSRARSQSFEIGLWHWYLEIGTVETNTVTFQIHLCIERRHNEQPPVPDYVLRFQFSGSKKHSFVHSVYNDRSFQHGENFEWEIKMDENYGQCIIEVEFLDLKIVNSNGETRSIWSTEEESVVHNHLTQHVPRCLSRIFREEILTDVSINTSDGCTLKAHKAILSSVSDVFQSMFVHDLENEPSTIDMKTSTESCRAFFCYIYGTIEPGEFLKHCVEFVAVADMYAILNLKGLCEDILIENIDVSNVSLKLQCASKHKLERLKKRCMKFLFDLRKIHALEDKLDSFIRHANRELIFEMFEEGFKVLRIDYTQESVM